MRYKLPVIFIFLILLSYLILSFEKQYKIDQYLDKQTELYSRLYEVHYHNYRQKSQMLFDTLVNRKEVIDIYESLQNTDKKGKDKLREKLYRLLKEKYKKMEYTQLRQLHFHLKNNESFLRMHKPGKFGDNLTTTRESVAYVNRYHKKTNGFEMGRVKSGLRFVYPITNNKHKHLGSVEVSFDIAVFSIEFMEHFKALCNFHLKSDILQKKTWKDSLEEYYIKSPIQGYYLEKQNTKILKDYAKRFNLSIMKGGDSTIKKALEAVERNQNITFYDKKTNSVITFLPVTNAITKKVVAFFSIRNFDRYVKTKTEHFYYTFAASVIFLSIIFYLLYREFKNKDDINKMLKKRIEEETKELVKANERLGLFKKVIDSVNAGATISKFNEEKKEHRIIYVNKTFEELTGYTKEEVIGKNLKILQGNDKEQDATKIIKEAISKKQNCKVEIRNYKKDGTLFYNHVTLSPIFNKEGEVTHYIGIQNDITQKKLDELKLQEQKNFLDTLIQTAPIPFFYKDIHGNYIDVNETWCKFTGFTKEEIIGRSVYEVAPKEIADIYHKQDQKVFTLEENPQIYESKVVNKQTKNIYEVMFYKSAFFNNKGEVAGLIGSLMDLTQIKQLQKDALAKEKLLFEQAKLASMGEMIANIAHQWRQPLSVISTASTGLILQKEHNLLKDEFFIKQCGIINDNAQYLSQTIDDFRNFIKGDSSKTSFYIKNSLNSFIKLVEPSIKTYNIRLKPDIRDNIVINGYPNELKQCFINIFNNSKDALVEINEDKRYIFINEYIKDNRIIIEFKDNGGGISEDIKDKIFEPYFTTKHQSQGTGLGLNMTYNFIVNHMNGKIDVENTSYQIKEENHKGALFRITLPLN